MKKFIVKYKDREKIFGEYASREEASKKLTEYIHNDNMGVGFDYASPFDFVLEEVELSPNDLIPDFESARQYLGLQKIDCTDLANEHIILRLEKFIEGINPKHIEALIALNELFTIAEAWNKADGFVPDFSDWHQDKWFPWFKYNKDAAGFVYAKADSTPVSAYANFGYRICFKTEERAEQFGKKFIELYNKVFL